MREASRVQGIPGFERAFLRPSLTFSQRGLIPVPRKQPDYSRFYATEQRPSRRPYNQTPLNQAIAAPPLAAEEPMDQQPPPADAAPAALSQPPAAPPVRRPRTERRDSTASRRRDHPTLPPRPPASHSVQSRSYNGLRPLSGQPTPSFYRRDDSRDRPRDYSRRRNDSYRDYGRPPPTPLWEDRRRDYSRDYSSREQDFDRLRQMLDDFCRRGYDRTYPTRQN